MNNVKITQLISCDISKVSVMQSRQLYVLRRVLQISAKKVFENWVLFVYEQFTCSNE